MKLIGARVQWRKSGGGTTSGEIVAVELDARCWHFLIVTDALHFVNRVAEDCELVPPSEGHPYR